MHRLALLTFLAVTLFASCTRSFALFPLVVDTDGAARSIALREREGRPPEAEGFLAPGETIDLALRDPVAIDAAGHELAVRFEGVPSGASIAVYDENGRSIAARSADSAFGETSGGGPVSIGVDLPGGTIARVRVVAGDRSPARLVGLEVRPARTGAAFESGPLADDEAVYLHLAPGVVVDSWNPVSRRWSVDLSGGIGHDPTRPVEIRYRYSPQTGAAEGTEYATRATYRLTVGGVGFDLDVRPGAHRVLVHPEVEGVEASTVSVSGDAGALSVEAIVPADVSWFELPSAVPVDMGTLLRYDARLWRQPDFELFSWTLYPRVLIVDSSSYEVQARFFKRLAFFVEKVGFRGTLLTDEELVGRHGYNAHNYSAAGLAEFFTAAAEAGIELTAEERLLREVVIENGIIGADGEAAFSPGSGGVLAVSQESDLLPGLRELLIAHEAYHGVYYAEPEYVEAIDAQWESLDEAQQRFWRLLLSGLRYDIADPYLLRNEYHAYLLQQPVAEARWYFESRSADRLRRWYPDLTGWLDAYFREYAGTHREQARWAEATLNRITGLVARDVFCVEPASP